MKIYFLTQEDSFYLPTFFERFIADPPNGCEIVGAAILEGEISEGNVLQYLKFFGPVASVKNGLHLVWCRVLDKIDRVRPLRRSYSVAGALGKGGIAIERPKNINDESFLESLRARGVDLVVSVACPQIVRKALLALPPKGCINIHGAKLPRYRGKLPSFWAMANGESSAGVTVHMMNTKLDDGPIILQREVPIDPDDTLHTLLRKSKSEYGPAALRDAIALIIADRVELQENDASQATYFSFPDSNAVREFKRRGRRFR